MIAPSWWCELGRSLGESRSNRSDVNRPVNSKPMLHVLVCVVLVCAVYDVPYMRDDDRLGFVKSVGRRRGCARAIVHIYLPDGCVCGSCCREDECHLHA